MEGFIQQSRSEEVDDLIRWYPNAFILLTVIARRLRLKDSASGGLKVGECFIGDWAAYGMSEQNYRTAKKHLCDLGLIDVKVTPRGTTAKLLNKRIYLFNFFDPNAQLTDGVTPSQRQPNAQLTPDQRPANDKQRKNKEESIKEESTSSTAPEFQKIPAPEKLEPWLEASNLIGLTTDLHSEIKSFCARRPMIDPVIVAHKVQARWRNAPPGEKYGVFQKWFISEFEPKPEPVYKLGMKRKGKFHTPHDIYCKISGELLSPEHPDHCNNVDEGHPNYWKPRLSDLAELD